MPSIDAAVMFSNSFSQPLFTEQPLSDRHNLGAGDTAISFNHPLYYTVSIMKASTSSAAHLCVLAQAPVGAK